MRIKTLKLYNFRSFERFETSFLDGINILYGKNAIGKTTILEAINYLSISKSFKTNDDLTVIKEHRNEMSVIGCLDKGKESTNLKITKTENGKAVFKDSLKFSKISDYIGELLVVVFSNNDMIDLNGNSKNRRKIFEPIFCQISKDYVLMNNYYKKILNERNALLKRLIIENKNTLKGLLEILDSQLIECAKKIIFYRKQFTNMINDILPKYHNQISLEKEEARLVYKPSVDVDNIEQEFKNKLSLDMKKGTTNLGPHRDDYVFIINNKNIVDYGSQGQQRSYLISLKVSFVELLFNEKKEYPILLLDDVLSELDKERQNSLFSVIKDKVQTILSTATLAEIDESILKNANIITLEKEM